MAGNNIGDDGAKALAAVLHTIPGLTSLNLSGKMWFDMMREGELGHMRHTALR